MTGSVRRMAISALTLILTLVFISGSGGSEMTSAKDAYDETAFYSDNSAASTSPENRNENADSGILSTPDNTMAALTPATDNEEMSTNLPEKFTRALTTRFPNEPAFADLSVFSGAERHDYAFSRKYVSVVLITIATQYIWLVYDKNYGGNWRLESYIFQNERGDPKMRVQTADGGVNYWVVVETESNHGSGTSLLSEIWYNPDGSKALQYDSGGYAMIAAYQDVDGKTHEPDMGITSRVNCGKAGGSGSGAGVYIMYWTDFSFDGQPLFRAMDNASYTFDPVSKHFAFDEKESTVPPPDSTGKDGGTEGWHTITRKYGCWWYSDDILAYDIKHASTAEEWVKILKRMGAKDVRSGLS